ncbi:MAG TPA: DUF3592 domain-containing protein [Candidatus Acidoferrum sp.]|nr:DUF3592 domain-containing protein [Candidatus Acidoferrum sp.]
MPFPQEQVAWILANRGKLLRFAFLPQLIVALLFLGFAHTTGKDHFHLLRTGIHAQGTIVAFVPVRFVTRVSQNSSSTFSHTAYMPVIAFHAGDRLVKFQEWKGSGSRVALGTPVPILLDPTDPSIAMMDRGLWNWLPWAPCVAIGLLLFFASLKGLFSFLTH